MFEKKKFLALIKQSPLLPDELDSWNVGGKVKASELHEIYQRRAESSGDLFQGFEDVLRTLKSLENTLIRVNVTEFKSKSHIVFTDKKFTEILGVLLEK